MPNLSSGSLGLYTARVWRTKWPYEFELRSTFELVEKTVRHTLAVYNTSEPELRFGIGYHPAFAIPFDDEMCIRDSCRSCSKMLRQCCTA